MTDSDRVLQYIDTYYRNSAFRPKMYFSSPEAYKNVVFVLEGLRDRLTGHESDALGSWGKYCVDQALQAMKFSSWWKRDHDQGAFTLEESFLPFVAFLRKYLESQGRLSSGRDDAPA